MNKQQKRGEMLQQLYELRSAPWAYLAQGADSIRGKDESFRVAYELYEHGLVEMQMLSRDEGAEARITDFGMAVVEGVSQAPIPISIENSALEDLESSSSRHRRLDREVAITIGISALLGAINESTAADTEKDELKSQLLRVLSHPLISEISGQAARLLN